jgi:hypothetical protein
MSDYADLVKDEAAELALMRSWKRAPDPLTWGGMLMRPGKPILTVRDLLFSSAVPCASGIYALRAADGAVIYIGRAVDLNRRLRRHYRATNGTPGLAVFSFHLVPEYALYDVEVAHIYGMQPENNALYEPVRWEGHDAMVAAVRAAWSLS